MINTSFNSPSLLMMDPGFMIGPASLGPIAPVKATPSPFDYFAPTDSVTLGSDLNSAADFLGQMADLKSLSQRQQAVSDLNTAELPANWASMPLSDFLDEMAKIRGELGPSKNDGAKEGGQEGEDDKGSFGVNAHRKWDSDKGEYVNVQSVQVHEKGDWNSRGLTTYNEGDFNDVTTSKEEPLGKTMQVEVTWKDGSKKVWDYTNAGQMVDVYYN